MKSKLLISTRNRKAKRGPHGKYIPRKWVEVARVGEWPNAAPAEARLPDGTEVTYPQGVVQVITVDSLNEMLENFEFSDTPTFFDKEHESTVPGKKPGSLAWVVDMQLGNASVDPSGQPGEGLATEACLWAEPRYSATGLNSVEGGEFLELSPHYGCRFLPGQETAEIPRVEPVFLSDVALTLKPNMRLTSISNARPDPVAPPMQNPVGPNGPTKPETKPKTTMKKLAALLGLPETATEDELAAALQAVLDSQKSTATEVANMKAAAADAFVTKHAASIPNTDAARNAWKQIHIANAAQAEAMIGGGAIQPAVVAPVQNAAPAVVPVFQPSQATPPATPGAAVETNNAVPDPSKMDDATLLKTYNSQAKGPPKAAFYRANKTRLSKLID